MSNKLDHADTAAPRAGRLSEGTSPHAPEARAAVWVYSEGAAISGNQNTKHPLSLEALLILCFYSSQCIPQIQDSLNHKCINLHFIIFLHHKVWYLQTTFLEALDSVRRFRVYDKMNYRKSVQWSLLCAWHRLMLQTDGSAPGNGFSFSKLMCSGTIHV